MKGTTIIMHLTDLRALGMIPLAVYQVVRFLCVRSFKDFSEKFGYTVLEPRAKQILLLNNNS